MDDLDLVKVYTPEGTLKGIERKYLSKALDSGFKLVEDAKPPKKESAVGEAVVGGAKLAKEAGKSALETGLEAAEDVARLGAQGATFGFSDEAMAALQALGESGRSEKSLADLYGEYKKLEEEKIQKSKERSPLLGAAAEFGGAVIPGIAATALTGGAAAPAVASRLLPLLGRAAVTGAVGGAITGAGASEGSLIGDIEFDPSKGIVYGEKAEKLGEDILGGAATGAISAPIFTGAMSLAGKAAKGVKGFVKKLSDTYDEAEHNMVAFQESKKGQEFMTKQAKDSLDERKMATATKLQQKIMNVENSLGNEIKASIDDATKTGVTFGTGDLSSFFNDSLKILGKREPSNRKVIEKINSIVNPEGISGGLMGKSPDRTDPRTLWDLRDEIKKRINFTEDKDEIAVLTDLSDKIREKLNTIKPFKEANEAFENFRTNAGETILHRGRPKYIDVTDPVTGQQKKIRIANYASDEQSSRSYYDKLQGTIFDDLAKIGRQGGSGDEARATAKALNRSLKDFEKQTGRSLKNYGIDPDELTEEFKYEGIVQGIKQKVHGYDKGYGEVSSPSELAQVPSIVKRPFLVARAAGAVAGGRAPGIVKAPAKVVQSIYKLPEAAMGKLADSISSKFPNYSRGLKEAIKEGNTYKKNALIFALMQNPDFRNTAPYLLEEVGSVEEEPSNE